MQDEALEGELAQLRDPVFATRISQDRSKHHLCKQRVPFHLGLPYSKRSQELSPNEIELVRQGLHVDTDVRRVHWFIETRLMHSGYDSGDLAPYRRCQRRDYLQDCLTDVLARIYISSQA